MTQAMSTAIYDEYERYIKQYQEEYGKNTVVLLQVGSFYELYSIDNGLLDIKTVAEALNLTVTRKNKQILEISKSNCLMAGFPEHALGKYMNILIDNNYTVVVVSQVTPPPKPKREVTEIKSPGTRIEEIKPFENNFLMCLYFEEIKDYRSNSHILSVGISYIDLSTGKSTIYECTSKPNDKFYALDETYRVIVATNPNEIILLGDIITLTDEDIIKYLDINNRYIHNHLNEYNKIIKNSNWQNQLLQKCFPNCGLLSPIEYIDLERKIYSTPSYVGLLQFAHRHSEDIINKLQKPYIMEDSNFVNLTYNTALQLNIIKSDNCKTSLIDILNNCKTAIGKRRFKERLLNPIHDISLLQNEYEQINYIINNELITPLGNNLTNIFDIERYYRRITMGKLHPADFIVIVSSLEVSLEIIDIISCSEANYKNLKPMILDFIKYLKTSFTFDELGKYHIDNITTNIFNIGIHKDLDILQNDYIILQSIFDDLISKLNCITNTKENQSNKFFKLDFNDKDGFSISITTKRFQTFKSYTGCNDTIETYGDKLFDLKLLTSEKVSSSSTILKLSHPLIKQLNNEVLGLLDQIKQKTTKYYTDVLKKCFDYEEMFNNVIEFISISDYRYSNAYNAFHFKYCMPCIKNMDDDLSKTKSYVIAKSIRHPIIERIQDNIEYVANDIELGTHQDGILLFGVNASGKSSIMKSVGLSVIMASAGMFVPCSEFTFFPYKSIFTRIPTGDNLSKGQSTFTNEISELRDTLKRANDRSLIIGDELCSGTESVSAMSIVSAGIITLCARKSSFIFATHLHGLTDINRIKDLNNLGVYHLSVEYNEASKTLVYDRKLQSGQGSTLYGLEVMKGLSMDHEFIELANEIRQGLLEIETNILSVKKTRYNSKLFKDHCAICNSKSTEVHHIKEQQNADANGFIGNVHKNILFNLVNLCTRCHDQVHHGTLTIEGYVQTTNGRKLQYYISE